MNSKNSLDLKLMRVKAGVKAIDVAISLGWSPSKLSLIENGRTRVSPELLDVIRETIGRLAKNQ
jgi:transcriptional regulator with XRE-family HTH domain